jgi:hypothetical protein
LPASPSGKEGRDKNHWQHFVSPAKWQCDSRLKAVRNGLWPIQSWKGWPSQNW